MRKYLLTVVMTLGLMVNTAIAQQESVHELEDIDIYSLIRGVLLIHEIQVTNNSEDNDLTIDFYDAPSDTLTWVNPGYIDRVQYMTNIVRSFTNYYGIVRESTNTVLWVEDREVSASTNDFRLVRKLIVPAETTVTWQPIGGSFFSFGLATETDTTNSTVQVKWDAILPGQVEVED